MHRIKNKKQKTVRVNFSNKTKTVVKNDTCGTIVNFERRTSNGIFEISSPSINIRPESASIMRNKASVREVLPEKKMC